MVFSIEPGIYLPGVGCFRFSDTVLVAETLNKKLTSAPETLAELTLSVQNRVIRAQNLRLVRSVYRVVERWSYSA